MEQINPDSENILILAVTGSVLSGIWLAYKLNLFKVISTIDEKKILLPSFLFLISPFLFPFIFKIIFNNNMLSQPTAINGGILGAVIAGIFLMINTQWMTSVNNKLQLEREEQQRTWQLEREKQQRIWQEESDNKRWDREKIYDSYKTSIQVLTKIMQKQYELQTTYDVDQDESINLEKLYFEFNSEFEIIRAGYADKDSEEFKEKMANIKKDLQVKPLLALTIITEMMENDSRIKVINK
jgi:hypothetical protein